VRGLIGRFTAILVGQFIAILAIARTRTKGGRARARAQHSSLLTKEVHKSPITFE